MTMQVNGSVGITFPDGTTQTTAYIGGTAGVSTFSAGATGLFPAGAATGSVSLGGVLNPTHGGTGTIDPNGILFFNGASPATTATPAQIVNQLGNVPVNRAINLDGGGVNQVPYQTAANTTGFVPAPTVTGSALIFNGTSPVWGNPNQAVNINGGLALQIPYQTAPNTTAFMAAPTNPNTTLIWDGSAFTWRNQGDTYLGTWDAATNTPTIVSSVGVNGQYYIVSVAGNTNINGISDWQVGDQIIFNGSVWQQVTGSGIGAFPDLIVSGLTGYMYANGASQVTASTTIPNTAITGLGTMSTQNANAVAVTGGTIDGTVIGASTPANGTFTNLTATVSASLSPTGIVTINPGTVSSMDNVIIGATTPVAVTGTIITATQFVGVSGGTF